MSKTDTSFIVVASGKQYINLSKDLIESIKKHVIGRYEIIVFTDSPEMFSEHKNFKELITVKIEHLDWPEATLLRYQLISKNKSIFSGSQCVYIDADALLVADVNPRNLLNHGDKMFFVVHPGYFSRGFFRMLYYRIFASPWEYRKIFSCYIKFRDRRHYVYGAFWGGLKYDFFNMCEILDFNTNLDLRKGLYPRSYDESYLNWYFNKIEKRTLLTPEYAYVRKFQWIEENIKNAYILFEDKSKEIVEYKNENDKRT